MINLTIKKLIDEIERKSIKVAKDERSQFARCYKPTSNLLIESDIDGYKYEDNLVNAENVSNVAVELLSRCDSFNKQAKNLEEQLKVILDKYSMIQSYEVL